jgi:hypothetical protein
VWESLPWEVRVLILKNGAIPLDNLARIASLGGTFRQAYADRVAADEASLERLTEKALGKPLVGILVEWFTGSWGYFEGHIDRTFSLGPGFEYPSPDDLKNVVYMEVDIPAWAMPNAVANANVPITLRRYLTNQGSAQAEMVVSPKNLGPAFQKAYCFALTCTRMEVKVNVTDACPAFHLPLLGLAVIITKRMVAPCGVSPRPSSPAEFAAVAERSPLHQPPPADHLYRLVKVNIPSWITWEDFNWDEAGGLDEDVRTALALLKVVGGRSHRHADDYEREMSRIRRGPLGNETGKSDFYVGIENAVLGSFLFLWIKDAQKMCFSSSSSVLFLPPPPFLHVFLRYSHTVSSFVFWCITAWCF